jgi:hypothetical protein
MIDQDINNARGKKGVRGLRCWGAAGALCFAVPQLIQDSFLLALSDVSSPHLPFLITLHADTTDLLLLVLYTRKRGKVTYILVVPEEKKWCVCKIETNN